MTTQARKNPRQMNSAEMDTAVLDAVFDGADSITEVKIHVDVRFVQYGETMSRGNKSPGEALRDLVSGFIDIPNDDVDFADLPAEEREEWEQDAQDMLKRKNGQ